MNIKVIYTLYFCHLMIALDFSSAELKLRRQDDKIYVFDPIRRKWLILTPEEHVRQYLLLYFINQMRYPASLIAVEKRIQVGNIFKRYDMVVYDRSHIPWMLVECKEPDTVIAEATLLQLLNYQRSVQCRYWMLSNGHQHFCADSKDIHHIQWLDELPAYGF